MEIGEKHGAWRVVETPKKGLVKVVCTACGKTKKSIRVYDLKAGNTLMCKSCAQGNNGKAKDPKTQTVYNTWLAMNQRCESPTCKDYKNYGARGITIYPLWKESFEAFYMMIGPKPSPDCTIERINVNGNYEPGNVMWLPRKLQPKNMRSNIRINLNGKNLLVSEWPEESECTVDQFCIYKRLKRGWPEEAAVLCPNGTKLSEWVKENTK